MIQAVKRVSLFIQVVSRGNQTARFTCDLLSNFIKCQAGDKRSAFLCYFASVALAVVVT